MIKEGKIMRSLTAAYVILAAAIVLVVLGVVGVYGGIAEAQSVEERFYYSDSVLIVQVPGATPVIRPRILNDLDFSAGDVNWSSKFHSIPTGIFILSITTTNSRHKQVFEPLGTKIGDTLEGSKLFLGTDITVDATRAAIQTEWNRLKDKGCLVPNDPVEIVGGQVQC